MHDGISTSPNAVTTHADGCTAPRHSCAYGGSGCLSPKYVGTPLRRCSTFEAIDTAGSWGTLDTTAPSGSQHSLTNLHELVQPRAEHLARSGACDTQPEIHVSVWNHPNALHVPEDASNTVMTVSLKLGLGLGLRLQ